MTLFLKKQDTKIRKNKVKVIPHRLIFFTLNQLQKSNLYVSSASSYWLKDLSFFYYGCLNGRIIFNLSFTLFSLRKSIFFIKEIYCRGGSLLVVNDDVMKRYLLEKSFKKIPLIFYINDSWVGGTLTNFKRIFSYLLVILNYSRIHNLSLKDLAPLVIYLKNYFEGISKMLRLPSCLFLISSVSNHHSFVLKEGNILEIPVVGPTNCRINRFLDHLVPSNGGNTSSISFYAYLIRNSYFLSLIKNKKKIIEKDVKFLTFKRFRSYKMVKNCLYSNLEILPKKINLVCLGYNRNKKINNNKHFNFKNLTFFLLKNNFRFRVLILKRNKIEPCYMHVVLEAFQRLNMEMLSRHAEGEKEEWERDMRRAGYIIRPTKKKKIKKIIKYKQKKNQEILNKNDDSGHLWFYLYLKLFIKELYTIQYKESNCISCFKIKLKTKKWSHLHYHKKNILGFNFSNFKKVLKKI